MRFISAPLKAFLFSVLACESIYCVRERERARRGRTMKINFSLFPPSAESAIIIFHQTRSRARKEKLFLVEKCILKASSFNPSAPFCTR